MKIKNLMRCKEKDIAETQFQNSTYEINPNALLYQHFHMIYFSLHLLYEVMNECV